MNTSRQGVGTELSSLLSRLGLKATPDCSCKRRAKLMDKQGVEWCDRNRPTIVRWLRKEAEKRKLPFSETAAKFVVGLAIKRAARKLAKSLGAG